MSENLKLNWGTPSMNQIEYECKECHYWEAVHGINGFSYKDEQFKRCNMCTRPMRQHWEDYIAKRDKETP